MSKVKILHTSDWHLGKKLYKADRFEEHDFFLSWLFEYLVANKVDILIIAGDIFDVPSPSNRALGQFYDFIYKIGKIPNFQSIIISGNHDSKDLLKAPALFFEEHNCFIYTELDLALNKHKVIKDDMAINFRALPYFRNFELTNQIVKNGCLDTPEYFNKYFETNPDEVNILISHHGFGQYSASGSEQAIHLSGLDYFPLEWVKHFDYVALGHIHKRQTLSKEPYIIYPGSPLALRFSESNKKYVSLIELDNTSLHQEYIELPQKKNLKQIDADNDSYLDELEKLIAQSKEDNKDYYLEIRVKLDSPQSGMADAIRDLLKDTKVELLSFRPYVQSSKQEVDLKTFHDLDILTLFKKYYKSKFEMGQMSDELLNNFKDLLEDSNENP